MKSGRCRRLPSGLLSSRRWARVAVEAKGLARWRCCRCGVRTTRLEAHHVRPAAEAPELAFDVENVRPLCPSCHVEEHRRPLSEEVEAWARLVAGDALGGEPRRRAL